MYTQEARKAERIMQRALVKDLSDNEKKRIISDTFSGDDRERILGYLFKKDLTALIYVSK